MELERWHRVDNILQAALALSPAERSVFVDSACEGDEALRDEVISLLSLDEEGLSIIDTPALEAAACVLASDQPDLTEGQFVGHFRILSLLGLGGMGEVYLAEDTKLGRKIALKLLPFDFSKDRDRVRRFQQEARSASALNHPYIVTIHETGEFEERHFIATEFIEGETLRQRMRRTLLNVSETLDIAMQVADALRAAHQAGIVHRDIKPENIMLRPDGYVKVLDFGLAKLTEQPAGAGRGMPASNEDNTTPGLLMGTVKYMSPEQARGLNLDARSDIFSLGVVIYEMLAGRPPFEGETNSDVITSTLTAEPPPLAHYSPEVPEQFQRILTKALRKETEERYQTINGMLADLKSLKQQLELASELPLAYQRTNGASRARRAFGYFKNHKLAAIAVALVLIGAVGWLVKDRVSKPSAALLRFNEREWVLITNFENRTGEELFDGTLEYAFERELSNSQYINVATRERIEDALRLMKKPPDAKVDAAVGREICLRDGAIRAMVSGRTERLGSTYVLSANLIDPDTSRVFASSTEEASSQQQVSPAVRRLSNWVRERLGESLSSIRQSDQQLEKVTTPSLRALQLYTQGETLLRQRNWLVAEQLFRQALAEDPEFASAHMMLAWSLSNQKKPEDEWKPPGDRALELSERVSERERFFIQGSYYSIRRQDNKAIPIYEALLQRYPDHYWGVNNLLLAYGRRPGRYEESFAVLIRSADLRPNDFGTQVGAALNASRLRRWDVAVRYLKRANELVSPEVIKQSPLGVAYVQFSLPIEHYLRGDLETALAEVDRLAQTVDSRTGQEREAFATWASNDYMWFGKLKAAEEFAQRLSPERERYYVLAGIAFARNDRNSLKKFLLDHLSYSEFKKAPALVGLLIRAGLLAEAKKILSNHDLKDEGFGIVSQGELALAQGQTTQAITLLQHGIQSLRSGGGGVNLNGGWESLAAAYERQGDSSNELRVLEEASQDNMISVPLGITVMRNKVRLAHLYRDLGRIEDAQKIEAALLYQLKHADADHSILRQLKHSSRL